MSKSNIYVTQPSMPPLDEFVPYLQKIWDSKVVSNCGPMHQKLEKELCDYLGVDEISLFNNGMIALLVAIQALGITGEVITTPYTFVATSHSLIWNNVKPVFVDIDPITLNIDPSRIEAAITPNTTAIVAVHCYGNPCDVEAIAAVAKKHNLKVIYDAAHAFGVEISGKSVLNKGDLSVLSFHATKLFHTFEGGAIVCRDKKMKEYIDRLKNFGYSSQVSVEHVGINGKLNEVSAAFGLLQLKYINENIEARHILGARYKSLLKETPGIRMLVTLDEVSTNHSYLPIFVEDDYVMSRDKLYEFLQSNGIFSRKYFFPLTSEFSMYSCEESAKQKNLSFALDASQRVLCLPIYPDLQIESVDKICWLIKTGWKGLY